MRTKILAGAIGLVSLVAVLPAQAQDAAASSGGGASTAGHASVGVLVGDGFKDGFNLGFGARGGYTLPMNLYIGGTFVYHLGSKTDLGPLGSVKYNIFYLGPEIGYDVAAGPVVIRPYAGVGYATAVATVDFLGISASTSQSKLSLWPGATLLYPLGGAFIGADARFVIISGAKDQNGDQFNAFSVFATAGMQF